MLVFGAYSESSQYGSLIPPTQATNHSPELGVDDSLRDLPENKVPVIL